MADLSPALLRQRRNLISISVFHLLFNFADISIAKVSLLGTELVVGRPDVLIGFAWCLLAYFCLRYLQYCNEDTVWQPILFRYRGIALNYAMAFANRDALAKVQMINAPAALVPNPEVDFGRFFKGTYTARFSFDSDDYPPTDVHWFDEVKIADTRLVNIENKKYALVGFKQIKFPNLMIVAAHWYAARKTALEKPVVSDHVLPLVLAFAAIAVSLYGRIS